jgi:hypothetical protein
MLRPREVLLGQKMQLEGLLHSQQVKLESEKNSAEKDKLRRDIVTTLDKIKNLQSRIDRTNQTDK